MKRRMNNRILRTFLCGACLMGCAVVPFLAPAQTLRTSYSVSYTHLTLPTTSRV